MRPKRVTFEYLQKTAAMVSKIIDQRPIQVCVRPSDNTYSLVREVPANARVEVITGGLSAKECCIFLEGMLAQQSISY